MNNFAVNSTNVGKNRLRANEQSVRDERKTGVGKSKKQFLDERSRKLGRKKRRERKRRRYISADAGKSVLRRENNQPDYIFSVPEQFSFTENLEETAVFFSYMVEKIKKAFPSSTFLIESKDVIMVTTDVIMYLIALMRNYKVCRKRMYSFYGTYPDDKMARQVYIESGFLKFVKSRSKKLPENNSKMSIMSGKKNDAVSAGAMCNFVSEKLGVPRDYSRKLYETIIEMMSNVYYHAYNDEEDEMVPAWYMYAEFDGAAIKFVFLDTGLGIGKTVTKNSLYEKVVSRIGIENESKLIKSALDGAFRTQTREINHGKGLPLINDFAHSEKVSNFHLLSGKGHCWFDEKNDIFHTQDLRNKINGTIYIFTFKNGG